jgi:large subunit ribosomal protein L25
LLNQASINTPISINIEGDNASRFTYIREIQKHPVTDKVLHVDFLEVSTSEEIISNISISLTGESPAIKSYGGIVNQTLRSLRVSALPKDLPEKLEIDLAPLDTFEKVLKISDLYLAKGISVLNDLNSVVVRISAPRKVETTDQTGAEIGYEPTVPTITEEATDGQ